METLKRTLSLQTEINNNTMYTSANWKDNFNDCSLSFMIDYIVSVHHRYVHDDLDAIGDLAEKVARLHGEQHTELIQICGLWKDIQEELPMLIRKEELVLFPYIKNLEKFSNGEIRQFPQTHVTTVKSPIRMIGQDHSVIKNLLGKIYHLSNGFTSPDSTSLMYTMLYKRLKEFTSIFTQYTGLESEILFPRAIMLEETLVPFK